MTRRDILALALLLVPGLTSAHDGARPELDNWFYRLRSERGPCCSAADGKVLIESEWESKDGQYRVKIGDEWIDVPDDAVVKTPNLDGRTMVWPLYRKNTYRGELAVASIRCFMPGAMT